MPTPDHYAMSTAVLGSLTPASGSGDVLASVNMDQDRARSWVVTLLGMRYQSGTIIATLPPENQVEQGLQKARITWGVGGALEEALVDYPWGGCSFTIHAATIRVNGQAAVLSQANIPPLIGAFITPGAVCGDQADVASGPTFTTTTAPVSAGAQTTYVIPRRARAYSPYVIDIVAADGFAMGMDQCFGPSGAVVKRDQALNSAPIQAATNNFPQDIVRRLHPRAETLVFTGNGGAITRNVGVIFYLDLG